MTKPGNCRFLDRFFFPLLNRNTKRIAIDLRKSGRAEVASQSAASADVVAEKSKPASIGKSGLHYAALSQVNERPVYVMSSTKAFARPACELQRAR